MLTKLELDMLCKKLGISKEGREYIDKVRSSPPWRRVEGRGGNMTVRYQSHKMDCTIQAESNTVEYPSVMDKDQDPNVLEFWDQPWPIKLNYRDKNDRPVGVIYTPDYFVIKKDGIGWEEWKAEANLPELAEKMPNRFRHDGTRWRCPPGEVVAKPFGFFFHVCSSADIDWIFQRNLIFLQDYLRAHEIILDENLVKTAICEVAQNPGVMLEELLGLENISADVIYMLIARGQLYVDLRAYVLAEPERAPVFVDQETAKGFSTAITVTQKMERPFVIVAVGLPIVWDGQEWVVTNIGETETTLLQKDGTHVEIPKVLFDEYMKTGKISNPGSSMFSETAPFVSEMMAQASPEDFEVANKRLEIITPYLKGHAPDDAEPTSTIRRYIRNWKNAEGAYGCGYIGLLRLYRTSGNYGSKLPKETRDEMITVIETKYENLDHPNMRTAYGALQKSCEEKGFIVPSYKTFVKAIHKRPQYEQTKAREGKRSAYQKQPFYYQLTMTTPRHGDHPFEICHIDHTELDLELKNSRTKRNLGKAWWTIMIDACTRRILAQILSFDPPSYRSCMLVLRECVRLHSRLPQIIVVDGGAEFRSTYFETFLARYGIHKKTRPAAMPRFGTVCERIFGSTNSRFIHNLKANTQITKNVRQVTNSVNPKNHALWTLPRLGARLDELSYEVYDTIDHPALGQTPREAQAMGLRLGGERLHKLIPYDDTFLMATLPTTAKGTAKINPQSGVKINYIYYWSHAFGDPDLAQVSVPIRYEPLNTGIAFAYVKKRWVKCTSEYYKDFAGKSQKEVQLATAILRRQNQLHNKHIPITSRQLANFLSSVKAEEELLEQRLHDAEYKEILRSKDISSDEDPETLDHEIPQDSPETEESPKEESDGNDTDFDTYKDF